MRVRIYRSLLGLVLAIFSVAAVGDTQQLVASSDFSAVGEVLLVILVLSVVFEVALTPVFNWRVFLRYAEGKGYKTPIVIGVALLVFWSYELDIIRDLLVALGHSAQLTFGGQLLTALLIAGGSDGVFRILTRLKVRDPEQRKQKAAQTIAAGAVQAVANVSSQTSLQPSASQASVQSSPSQPCAQSSSSQAGGQTVAASAASTSSPVSTPIPTLTTPA